METRYQAPKLTIIGSVHDVTQQLFNKLGLTPDALAQAIIGPPIPPIPRR
jgi:hypothetical protein